MTSVYVTLTTARRAWHASGARPREQRSGDGDQDATAEWKGDLPGGTGTFSGASGHLDGAYSFQSRFEEGGGTNPEELIAAAHASCFSMSLALILEPGRQHAGVGQDRGARSRSSRTARASRSRRSTSSRSAACPGVDDAAFQQAAQAAKENCPISKALAAVPEIKLEARLES